MPSHPVLVVPPGAVAVTTGLLRHCRHTSEGVSGDPETPSDGSPWWRQPFLMRLVSSVTWL